MERSRQWWLPLSLTAVMLLALFLRTAGLFRGLEEEVIFHPDAPKQMLALRSYLEGRYVWYFDSPYYDGYPYGLNRVDEVLIRAVRIVTEPLRRWLDPQAGPPRAAPGGMDLYVWARSLRVLYGLVTVLLGFVVARRVLASDGAALVSAFLLAVSPLAAAVTHEATGDVGVDLFAAAVAAVVCMYALNRRFSALLLCGVLCGLGFAAKYQGALLLLMPAACLLLEFLFVSRRPLRLAGGALACAAGFVAGTVAATPAFLVNGPRTWKNMVTNFYFIRDYGVERSFLEKPWHEKMHFGLTRGLPFIVSHIGWVIVLLALGGLALATFRLLRARGRIRPDSADMARRILAWSLCVFPFFVLLVSTAFKPAVQPFHFSYIVMPLCLGVAVFLHGAVREGGYGRAVAALLFVWAAAGSGVAVKRETFFWAREDTRQAAMAFARGAFTNALPVRGDLPPSRWVIKYFGLEKDNPAIFRNPRLQALHDHAPFWRGLQIAPVPHVPFPGERDYLFFDGPLLPRSDRLFAVPAGASVRRQLVAYGGQQPLLLGLRTGPVPAEVTISVGRVRLVKRLGENSQELVPLYPGCWKRVRGSGPHGEDVCMVPLRVSSKLGACWVSVLTGSRELGHFELFGGDPAATAPVFTDAAEIVERVGETRFLDGDGKPLALDDPKGSWVLPAHAPLPAGRYVLECRADSGDEPCEVQFELIDPRGLPDERVGDGPRRPGAASLDGPVRAALGSGAGPATLRYRFAKTFSPHEVNIRATCSIGHCRITDWRLVPDTEAILADFQEWSASGRRPAWCAQAPAMDAPAGRPVTGARFGRSLELKERVFPDVLVPGTEFELGFRFDVGDFGLKNFHELVVYVHLDQEGRTKAVFDYPLSLACFGSAPLTALRGRVPADLEPGEYDLAVGVYNVRTRRRLAQRDGPVILGKVRVEP